jgi:hypothetical protein
MRSCSSGAKSECDVRVPCQSDFFAVDGELHERNLVEISEVAICSENVQHILQRRLARFDSIGYGDAMELFPTKVQLDWFSNNFVIGTAE